MNNFVNQYLITALWSSVDDSGNPLDKDYSVSDIDKESVLKAEKDCEDFLKQAGSLVDGEDMDQVAHDFWLTRNGHGSGFWDGDYEKEKGEKLTEISKSFGEKHCFVQNNQIIME